MLGKPYLDSYKESQLHNLDFFEEQFGVSKVMGHTAIYIKSFETHDSCSAITIIVGKPSYDYFTFLALF